MIEKVVPNRALNLWEFLYRKLILLFLWLPHFIKTLILTWVFFMRHTCSLWLWCIHVNGVKEVYLTTTKNAFYGSIMLLQLICHFQWNFIWEQEICKYHMWEKQEAMMFSLKGSFLVEVLFSLSIMTNNSVSCLTDFQQILSLFNKNNFKDQKSFFKRHWQI